MFCILLPVSFFQARNKPADGSTIASQKLQAGQRTPTHGPKNAAGKPTGKPGQKPVAAQQKGQPIKQAPAKVAAAAATKNTKKTKKGKHHQHDLLVTIDLVRIISFLELKLINFKLLKKVVAKYKHDN